jgi:hypothetical protein
MTAPTNPDADPLAWFDPPICCGCYATTARRTTTSLPGWTRSGWCGTAPSAGCTTGPHTEACSRSGVMLGERHHRQAEGETG